MVLFTGISTPYKDLETIDIGYDDMGTAIDALDSCGRGGMPPCSGTHVGIGMEMANTLLQARPTSAELGRAMVILGDGLPNAKGPNAHLTNDQLKAHAVQQSDVAAANGISVFTVFYDEDNSDTAAAFFESLIRGDGKALRTPEPTELPELFEDLCAQVAPKLVL